MQKLVSQFRVFDRALFELLDSVQKTCYKLINAQGELASINKPILSGRPTAPPTVARFGVTVNKPAPKHSIEQPISRFRQVTAGVRLSHEITHAIVKEFLETQKIAGHCAEVYLEDYGFSFTLRLILSRGSTTQFKKKACRILI